METTYLPQVEITSLHDSKNKLFVDPLRPSKTQPTIVQTKDEKEKKNDKFGPHKRNSNRPLNKRDCSRSLNNAQSRTMNLGKRSMNLSCGLCTQEGKTHENEDRYVLEVNKNFSDEDKKEITSGQHSLFGVVDGHGGLECSQYASEKTGTILQKEIQNHLNMKNHDSDDTECISSDEAQEHIEYKAKDHGNQLSLADMRQIMKSTFLQLDQQFVNTHRGNSSGACVCLVWLHQYSLVSGWVGDCRMLLYDLDEHRVVSVTSDHTLENRKEKQRVEKAKIPIMHNRLFGMVEPTRTIGDTDIKELNPLGLISTPQILQTAPPPHGFMVIASDGLWSVLNNSQVVEIAKDVLHSCHSGPIYVPKQEKENQKLNFYTAHKRKPSLQSTFQIKNSKSKHKNKHMLSLSSSFSTSASTSSTSSWEAKAKKIAQTLVGIASQKTLDDVTVLVVLFHS